MALGWVRTLIASKAWSRGSLAGNSENATYQSHVSVYVPITLIFKLHGDLGIRDLLLLSAIQVNWFSNEDLHTAYLAVQQKWKSDDFVLKNAEARHLIIFQLDIAVHEEDY